MKNKTLILATIIIIALGLVYFLQNKSRPVKNVGGGYVKIFSDDFNPTLIKMLKFYTPNQEDKGVTLLRDEKDAEEWIVPSLFQAKGNKQTIGNLLNDLKNLEGDERADAKEVFADFGIGDNDALHFVLYGAENKERYHLLIGKPGPSFSDGFVRLNGKNEIYLVNKNFRSLFGVSGEGAAIKVDSKKWTERKIVDLAKDKIVRVSVNNAGKNFLIERKEKVSSVSAIPEIKPGGDAAPAPAPEPKKEFEWIGLEPKTKEPWKNDQIDSLLSLVSNFYVDDFADPQKIAEYGIKDTKTILTFSGEDNKEYKFYFGKKENGKYYMIKEGGITVYLVDEYKFKNIADKAEELAKGVKK